MRASFVDFRKKSGAVIRALRRNEEITVLYRGEPVAVMKPITRKRTRAETSIQDDQAFGIWKDRQDMKDVKAYVRRLRRGRFNDL